MAERIMKLKQLFQMTLAMTALAFAPGRSRVRK